MAPTRPYYAEKGLSAAFYDTVTAADDLRRLFGRLRVKERGKIDLIGELIEEAVDLDRLVADLQA